MGCSEIKEERGKVWGLILVVPIFTRTREEGAQDNGLSSSLWGISTSFLLPSLSLPSLPLSFSPIHPPTSLSPSIPLLLPFSFPQIFMNYLFCMRPCAIEAGNTMLKKLTGCFQEAQTSHDKGRRSQNNSKYKYIMAISNTCDKCYKVTDNTQSYLRIFALAAPLIWNHFPPDILKALPSLPSGLCQISFYQ